MMMIPASFQQLLAQIEPPAPVVAAANGQLRAIRVRGRYLSAVKAIPMPLARRVCQPAVIVRPVRLAAMSGRNRAT